MMIGSWVHDRTPRILVTFEQHHLVHQVPNGPADSFGLYKRKVRENG